MIAETGERVAGGAGAQVGQLRVERVARAGGLVAVAVAADALEDDRRAGRVAVGLAAAGDQRHLAADRDAVELSFQPISLASASIAGVVERDAR